MSQKNRDHNTLIYGVDGSINPDNKWFRTMRFPTIAQRGYALGERNPDTLPDGSNERESIHENERHTRFWYGAKSPLAYALNTGSKYV